MLPVLSILDYGPGAGWAPSAEIAIARTKWMLASQKWLHSSCIVTLHFNDTRLPEIAHLVDWVKSIGGEFSTLEEMMADTFMSPTLEPGAHPDLSSFSNFDTIENTRCHAYQISFALNHPVKLRIDTGEKISYCMVNGKRQETKGQLIVTELLDAGKENTILIQIKSSST